MSDGNTEGQRGVGTVKFTGTGAGTPRSKNVVNCAENKPEVITGEQTKPMTLGANPGQLAMHGVPTGPTPSAPAQPHGIQKLGMPNFGKPGVKGVGKMG